MAENLPPERTDSIVPSDSPLARARAGFSEMTALVSVEAMRAWLSIVAKGEFDACRFECSDH
jgi:hypothetical protein